MHRHVAVLDIGKTNVKVVLHDLLAGEDVAVLTRPSTVRTDGLYPHIDTDAIFAFACDALRDVAGRRPVDAVSVTTHGAAAALVAADGALALPVMDYEFAGVEETAEAYEAIRPPFSQTFSPRLPLGLNLGAQLFHQKSRFADAFERAAALVTFPQLWGLRLTGRLASDVTSLGCHTDLWEPGAGRPSTLLARLGLAGRLAPVRRPADVLGPLSAEAARATGLPEGIPVHVGIHDSNASLLPHLLARAAPFTVVSTGTWTILFAVGGRLDTLDPARDTLANVDAFGRPVPSARFMGGREFEIMTGGRAPEPTYAEVDRVIAREAMALPSFAGGSGPFPGRAGTWAIDPATLSPGERTVAASFYAAAMTAVALDLVGADGPTIVEGPFARNDLILGALGALTGRPVLASGGATGTAAGAALLAAGAAAAPPVPPPLTEVPALVHPGFAGWAAAWTRAVARVPA